jgi:hypothetical protein
MLSAIYGLFTIGVNHEGRKPGEMSAYSIFNDGFKNIIGTFSAETFERELRRDPGWSLDGGGGGGGGGGGSNTSDDDNVDREEVVRQHLNNREEQEIDTSHQSRKRRAYQERLRRRRARDAAAGGVVGDEVGEWETEEMWEDAGAF